MVFLIENITGSSVVKILLGVIASYIRRFPRLLVRSTLAEGRGETQFIHRSVQVQGMTKQRRRRVGLTCAHEDFLSLSLEVVKPQMVTQL